MRGSFFSASPWARQPMRPIARRMGQAGDVVCDGDVCRITRPPVQTPPTNTTPSTTTTPTTTSSPPVETESSFPVVPVVAGLGGVALLALLLRG